MHDGAERRRGGIRQINSPKSGSRSQFLVKRVGRPLRPGAVCGNPHSDRNRSWLRRIASLAAGTFHPSFASNLSGRSPLSPGPGIRNPKYYESSISSRTDPPGRTCRGTSSFPACAPHCHLNAAECAAQTCDIAPWRVTHSRQAHLLRSACFAHIKSCRASPMAVTPVAWSPSAVLPSPVRPASVSASTIVLVSDFTDPRQKT